MWDIKQYCERSDQKIVVFVSLTSDILRYISRQRCKIVHCLYFTYISGATGAKTFLGGLTTHWPPPGWLCIAQWLERRSPTGELSLASARSAADV